MSTTSSLEGNYSPPSPLDFSYPYTASSIYPDRPIRPLPKRRLRSRLSPEVFESILFPRVSPPSFVNQIDRENLSGLSRREAEAEEIKQDAQQRDREEKDSYQFKGNELSNGIDDDAVVEHRYPNWRQRGSSAGVAPLRNGNPGIRNDHPRHVKPSVAPSATSSADSVDGYDSFENTNNKKKRKIPISGSIGNHSTSLSADLAHMDISSTRDVDASQIDADAGASQYYGVDNTSPHTSLQNNNSSSGPSKSRLGRSSMRRYSGRSPLAPSLNGSNAVHTGRIPGNAKDLVFPDESDKSISSQPLVQQQSPNHASGAARTPTIVNDPSERASLRESQNAKKANSSKTQFTFTCGSESSKNVAWPGYGHSQANETSDDSVSCRGGGQMVGRGTRGVTTQATQTSPKVSDHTNQPQQATSSLPGTQQPRKPRRSLAKQLAMNARERRLQQDYENYHSPPKEDKIWVCQYCEYESIFGYPPEALIRQYEIKDRRERRRLAEKQRLLEKAKMKNKKGKKGSKNKNSSAANGHQQNTKQRPEAQTADHRELQSPGNQSDEYILDEYEDEQLPSPNTTSQPPSKIPQPVNQSHNHSMRPPGGSGGGQAKVSA